MKRSFAMVMLSLALLGSVGCANRKELESTPAWATEKGKLETRLELTEVLLDANALNEALMAIAVMRKEDIRIPEVDYLQGRALLMQGVTSEAERLLLSSAEHMRKDPRPWRMLGVLYSDQGRLEDAIEALKKAIEIHDHDAATYNNLGFMYMANNDWEQASLALQRSVALDGTVPRYRNNLGFALARTGNHQDALRAFRSTGSHADAESNLALAYEMSGDNDNALAHYNRALEYSPSHVTAHNGITRLSSSPESEQ